MRAGGRLVAGFVLLAALLGAGPRARAAGPEPRSCAPRLLVLSAFPAELDAVLHAARLRPRHALVVEGQSFWPARIGRRDVLLAFTGIGPVNATATTARAFGHFCIDGVVFSGVAGSSRFIGDVTVPRRWTGDGGTSWLPVDPAMYAVAQQVVADGPPKLLQDNPAPDPLCLCAVQSVRTVHLPHAPAVILGGDGVTTDPLGGRALPCVPGAGDIFGCRVCRARAGAPADALAALTGLVPFVDPDFFLGYLAAPPASDSPVDASDNETAAVFAVAAAHHVPFLGFRGVSDGAGDPLMLPGFPVQFFVYYRVAAENAGRVAVAFIRAY